MVGSIIIVKYSFFTWLWFLCFLLLLLLLLDLSETSCRYFAAVDEGHSHLLVREALDELRFKLGILGVLHEQVFNRLCDTASLLCARSELDLVFIGLNG